MLHSSSGVRMWNCQDNRWNSFLVLYSRSCVAYWGHKSSDSLSECPLEWHVSTATNAAYCLLVIRSTSGAWVNYRTHLAGAPGHIEQLWASGGAWNFYVSVSDWGGVGWLISTATEKQIWLQTGTKVPQIEKYCGGKNQFHGVKKKRIFTIFYYT